MRHIIAGVIAATLLLGAGAAKAALFTPSGPIERGDPFTVLGNVATPGLVGFDLHLYLAGAPGVGFYRTLDNPADGTAGGSNLIGHSIVTASGSTGAFAGGVNLLVDPRSDLTDPLPPNFGSPVSGKTAVFRANDRSGGTQSSEEFLLYFLTLPSVPEISFDYRLDQFTDINGVRDTITTRGTISVALVPLPAGAPLILTGLAALVLIRRRAARAA